ncbi:MAG TPA: Card1-like endonuclease domain-containing protein [Candidatus Brocadiia bacterium]|nr:DUF1887 family CARF protein [Candidatus Brocadiales bacterium]
MKKILISLISEQTIPNILVTIHYKPDILWFISTERMEKERKTECIEDTLKLKGLLPPTVEKVTVDQNSLEDCINKIESLIEKVDNEFEYIVNITGGNKVMAIAAYEIFREIGQKVVIDYLPLGTNELVQIFPRKKPLKICEIKKRLNLEEYLRSYGFKIQNKDELQRKASESISRKDGSKWIMNNYEQLKEVLGFLYKNLKEARNIKRYPLSATYDRNLASIESEMLNKNGFETKGRQISKDMNKEEVVYLTGGWFEEYVFNEVFDLKQEGLLDDAMVGINIEDLSGVLNELDIAFVKENIFYHIECKTLTEGEKDIVRDEVYKKGAISTLLGKGEKRAMICTTLNQISESITKRAQSYGVEILPIEQVRNLKDKLRERFGVQKYNG